MPLPPKKTPTAVPPAEAKALSKLAQLREAEPLRSTTWPGSDVPLKLRALSASEAQECLAAANKRFQSLGIPVDTFHAEEFYDELGTQVLARACRSAENPKHSFTSVEDIRENATPDVRTEMLVEYNDHRVTVAPTPREIGPDVYEAMAEALKKKDRTRLIAFGPTALASYLLSMADPPSSSPTGTSSDGASSR